MTKAECEKAIRSLVHDWAKLRGVNVGQAEMPSFSDFFGWVTDNYPRCLQFRTTTSVRYDVEMWFDQELKQTWRN
jgi:hypothetical protein